MTPVERFRELIDKVPPLERQAVLESMLEIAILDPVITLAMDAERYVSSTSVEMLHTTYPVGGSWSRRIGKRRLVRRGISSQQARALAWGELEEHLRDDGSVIALARPVEIPGLIVGWLLARLRDEGGDAQREALVLCYTQEHLRRCGVQRLLMRQVFSGGRPRYHVYEPRGSAEFLRRLGTEKVR